MKVSSPKQKIKVITVRIAMRGEDHTSVTARGSEDPGEVLSAMDRAYRLIADTQSTDVDNSQKDLLEESGA